MNIIAVHRYVSPRGRKLTPLQKEVRRIAYSIKDPASPDFRIVAAAMLRYIPLHATLVPVPGHNGSCAANNVLCHEILINHRRDVRIWPGISRPAAESQCELDKAGKRRYKAGELCFCRTCTAPFGPIVFIDNVVKSGATLRACRKAVGRGIGVVWADARPVKASTRQRQPGLFSRKS